MTLEESLPQNKDIKELDAAAYLDGRYKPFMTFEEPQLGMLVVTLELASFDIGRPQVELFLKRARIKAQWRLDDSTCRLKKPVSPAIQIWGGLKPRLPLR